MLTIEFSVDGTNWDNTTSFAVTADVTLVKKLSVTNIYCRVKFLNDSGSDQTYLRLTALQGSQALDVNLNLDNANLATSSLQTTGNATLATLNNKVIAVNTGAVVVSGSVLPAGGSTSALQIDANVLLGSLNSHVTACNTNSVVVSGSVLPAGAATSALQTSGNASLTSIDNKVAVCNTSAVQVSSSALPAGGSTSLLQTAGNASLASLDGKVTTCNTGAVTVGSSALPAGAATSALQTSGNASLTNLDGKVIACNTGNVTVGSSVLPTGGSTAALQTSGNATLTDITSKITACNTGSVTVSGSALPTGAATGALQTAGNATLTSLNNKVTAVNTGAVVVSSSVLPTGGSTSDLQTSGNATLTSMDGRLTTIATNTVPGTVNSGNSSNATLGGNATFTGVRTDVSMYASVCVSCKASHAGTLYIDFNPNDNDTDWDSTLTFTVDADVNEVHRLSVTRRFFRVRFVNSATPQSYFRLQTLLGFQTQLTSTVNSTIQSDADAVLTRSVLTGKTDGGFYKNVPVTNEGHLEISVHEPLLPFGSLHTESMIPVFQVDAVYGINDFLVKHTSSGTGTVIAEDSLFKLATGVNAGSFASLQSRKRLRYRPGQGIIGRFAGRFNAPALDSYQVMGIGHSEDGVYFGYKGTDFGIIYNNRGVRECRTLTLTVAANANTNTTVTLNGVATAVAVTNSANLNRTAYEISRGTYAGWDAEVVGATVIFLANGVGSLNGTYSISGAGITGTFDRTKAGTAVIENFIPQSSWNGDKLDGTGSSGFTCDWTKGNVFQIGIQYLGFGALTFKVETATSSASGIINNPVYITVHIIKLPNTLVTTSFRNPSFPYTMSAYSAGSTSNLEIAAGSFAGFIEGAKMMHGNRYSYFAQSTVVSAASYHMLFCIYNKRFFKGTSNQSVINVLSMSAALKHTSPCIIYVVRNPTLVGNVVFNDYSTSSCSTWATLPVTATVTWADNSQLVWSGHLGDTSEFDHSFITGNGLEDFTLQPGEMIAICARTTTGNASYVTASVNTREDQ